MKFRCIVFLCNVFVLFSCSPFVFNLFWELSINHNKTKFCSLCYHSLLFVSQNSRTTGTYVCIATSECKTEKRNGRTFNSHKRDKHNWKHTHANHTHVHVLTPSTHKTRSTLSHKHPLTHSTNTHTHIPKTNTITLTPSTKIAGHHYRSCINPGFPDPCLSCNKNKPLEAHDSLGCPLVLAWGLWLKKRRAKNDLRVWGPGPLHAQQVLATSLYTGSISRDDSCLCQVHSVARHQPVSLFPHTAACMWIGCRISNWFQIGCTIA